MSNRTVKILAYSAAFILRGALAYTLYKDGHQWWAAGVVIVQLKAVYDGYFIVKSTHN